MKKLFLLFCLLLSMTNLFSQPNTLVTGIVTDKAKQTMPGVSIVIKGTTKGTVTDSDGKYSIQVPGDGTLVFSFLGYKPQEIAVNNRTTINVMLEESMVTLSEFVVVGYGVQRKIDVTGSVAQIKGQDLSKQISPNPISSLQGKVAGVQITNNGEPGKSPDIRIRGLGTYWGSSKPLYVVDGVWLDNVDFLNSNDIESVNILKDASSEAIYGIRGANGVIIISTKKGGVNENPTVTYDGTIGWQKATNPVAMANGFEYAVMFNELNRLSGSTSSLDTTKFAGGTNWFNQMLRNGIITNHQISVNGGGAKSNYHFSLGYLNQQGLLKDNHYQRYTGNLVNDIQISIPVKAGYSLTGSYSNSNDIPTGIWHQIYSAPSVLPVWFADHTTYGDPGYYGLGSSVQNPQATLDFSNVKTVNYHVNANAYVDITFLRKLVLRSSIGGTFDQKENRAYTPVYTATSTQSSSISNLALIRYETRQWIIDNTLTYSDTIGKHRFTALVGQNAQYYNYGELHTSAQNVPNVNLGNWYLGLGNTSFATDVDFNYNQAYPLRSTIASYFGRINYSYNDRYLLNATLRADGSSKFSKGDRWGYFPSVGLGWIISSENFMKNQTAFNSLKLKASWGKVGNAGVPTFASAQQTVSGGAYGVIFGNSGVVSPGVSVASILPPALQWERGVGTDIGLEAVILDNRLSIEADFYRRQTQKIIMNVYLPGAAGLSNQFITTNVGDARNQGVELSLTWKSNTNNKDFTYSINGNISYNKNKFVSNSAGGQKIYDGGVGANNGQFTTLTSVGLPIGSFYGYKVIGVFQTLQEVADYKDSEGTLYQPGAKPGDLKFAKTSNNGIGAISGNDRVVLGNPNPRLTYGLNTYWSYRKFDFTVDFQGVAGVEVYNANKGLRYGAENWTLDFYKHRWHGQGTSNSYPSANIGSVTNSSPSSWMVEKGSYFRIRTIQLGYTFASDGVKKYGMQSLRLFVNSQNPFTFFKYTGFTPEVGGSPGSAGIDTNVYPLYATYNFGVNVVF